MKIFNQNVKMKNVTQKQKQKKQKNFDSRTKWVTQNLGKSYEKESSFVGSASIVSFFR